MTTKMWAVSSGEYSDYRVSYLCRTEKEAEAIAKILGDDGHGSHYVEDFEVVEPSEFRPVTRLTLQCRIHQDGTVTDVPPDEWTSVDRGQLPDGAWSIRLQTMRDDANKDYLELIVYGWDHEQVRHVYSDRRAQLIATGWLDRYDWVHSPSRNGTIPYRKKPGK